MAMANQPGAPRWMDREGLGLNVLEHQIVALALAHLVCIQVAGPFEPDWERPCGFPRFLHGMDFLYRLDLPAPEGILLLDRALQPGSPLLANGLLVETSEVDDDQADTAGRFMYRSFSIRLPILHALLEPRSCPPESTTP